MHGGKKFRQLIPKLLLLIPVVGVILLAGRFVIGLPLLSVATVQFNGPISPSAQQQITTSLKGQNILSLSNDRVKKAVADAASVSVLNIDKKFPNTVVITVGVTEAVLSWQSSRGRFLVDQSGNVYAAAGGEQIPQISSPATSEEIGSKINPEITDLVRQLGTNFTVLTATVADGSIRVHITTGQDVIFPEQGDVASEIQALQLIAAKAKIDGRLPRIVDLRFSKPVVSF